MRNIIFVLLAVSMLLKCTFGNHVHVHVQPLLNNESTAIAVNYLLPVNYLSRTESQAMWKTTNRLPSYPPWQEESQRVPADVTSCPLVQDPPLDPSMRTWSRSTIGHTRRKKSSPIIELGQSRSWTFPDKVASQEPDIRMMQSQRSRVTAGARKIVSCLARWSWHQHDLAHTSRWRAQ